MKSKKVKVNEKFKSNVLLILLKMCKSLLECIMLLEDDFQDLNLKKIRVTWRKFANDFANLVKKKSSGLPVDAEDLNLDLNLDLGDDCDG